MPIKCWIVPFGTSCCWKAPLISIGADSAELLICCCSTSAIPQGHIEKQPTYSWNNSAKILNNQKSTLRKGSRQKLRVSCYRFTLLFLWHTQLLNPVLICNFVQGTRKTSETTLLSTSISVQNQFQCNIHTKRIGKK